MAAPTLSGNKNAKQKDKSDSKAQNNSSTRKKAHKNILLPPFKLEWPDVTDEVENRTLSALILKLKEFPRLEPERKRAGAGSKDKCEADSDDDLVRQRLRHQLAVGHRQVCKHLERDQLALVLVWRDPSLLVRSLLPLAATRHCPALCLKTLMPRITEATGLSSLVALGFKKTQPGLCDFSSFITLASSLAPSLSVPWMKKGKESATENLDTTEIGAVEGEGEMETDLVTDAGDHGIGDEEGPFRQPAAVNWPVLPAEKQDLLLEKLTGILQPFKCVFKKPKPRFTSMEWKLQRKTIRALITTDLVAIRDAATAGRLDLLLVQSDPDLSSSSLTSVVVTAVKKGCPTLHLTSLRKRVMSLTRNPLLKAVGFKTPAKDVSIECPPEFTAFIREAKELAAPYLKSLFPAHSSPSSQEQSCQTTGNPAVDNTRSRKKVPIPVYDVSHLYIYKKAPDEVTAPMTTTCASPEPDQATENKRRKVTLSVDTESFISLSAEEPTVQILGRKVTESAYMDTAGRDKQARLTARADDNTVEMNSSESLSGVMGLDATDAPSAVDTSPLFRPDPPKSKVKANLKRKLSSGAASGDFVSFKLAPTVVGTSVANPSKKRKEKKKRKR